MDQATGEVRVRRMFVSEDSGPVSNPDGMRNQVDGGAIQGMSRALLEEVRWNSRNLTSVDWRTYGVYTFGMFHPVIETVLIDWPDEEHMGAGVFDHRRGRRDRQRDFRRHRRAGPPDTVHAGTGAGSASSAPVKAVAAWGGCAEPAPEPPLVTPAHVC